ncbi:hypothetical protein [Gordonia shandongensis]|uniref:hypothetical protein n=1 Tax=Gordonia shandongensis TaxID=376351 RepID=UPI00041F0D62|nr:hypothetical protein [Gordonia shandongensis]
MSDTSDLVIDRVARALVDAPRGHPWRVGVDGICGAGKSTFARALAATVRALGRPVVFVASDGFHHVAARRHRRRDTDSARGYYEDAYDFDSLAARVLRPLGPGGDLRFVTKIHDLESDRVVTDHRAVAPVDCH